MAARSRIAAAAVVAVVALAAMVLLIVHIRAAESDVGHLSFTATSPAGAPFAEFDAAHVGVGSECLHVLVALSETQRVQGLRDVQTLAPYDGMLFVNPSDTRARYTMANTPMPLDITFFAANGEPVDRTRMAPCPGGTDATCPEYASKTRYRYALERPAGSGRGSTGGSGALGACSS